jgi:DNA-binding NtrC family response regulator
MGGVELAKRLIAHQPGTKIILMSGYSDQLGNQKDEAIAPFLILQKPFSMNSLAAALREVLTGKTLTGNGGTRVKQSS